MATDEFSAPDSPSGSTSVPTAPIAAAGLMAGFGVAVATGPGPLGGVVLAACGLACIAVWLRRDGTRVTVQLTAAGLLAFVDLAPAGAGDRGVAVGDRGVRGDGRAVLAGLGLPTGARLSR